MRPARPSDAEAVRDLTRAAYAKWIPVIGREPKPMGVDYDLAVREHRISLLYLDQALAGLIETVDEEDRLLIENVAIAPEFQGRGLGSILMAHAEAVAASLGFDQIRLYTNQQFAENIRLYLSLGYGVDREEDMGGGTIRVDMSKRLAPGPEQRLDPADILP